MQLYKEVPSSAEERRGVSGVGIATIEDVVAWCHSRGLVLTSEYKVNEIGEFPELHDEVVCESTQFKGVVRMIEWSSGTVVLSQPHGDGVCVCDNQFPDGCIENFLHKDDGIAKERCKVTDLHFFKPPNRPPQPKIGMTHEERGRVLEVARAVAVAQGRQTDGTPESEQRWREREQR